MAKSMPKDVLKKMKSKPKPKKSSHAVPPALKRWHETHPNKPNAHKSYGPNKTKSPAKSKPKGKGK